MSLILKGQDFLSDFKKKKLMALLNMLKLTLEQYRFEMPRSTYIQICFQQ